VEPTCFSNAITVPEWQNAMQVEFNALLQNRLGLLFLRSLLRMLSAVNGSSNLKGKQMVPLNATKPDLLPKAFINKLALIMERPIVRLLSLQQSARFYLLPILQVGLSSKLIFKMHSFMVFYPKMFTWCNHPAY
jgi:hypothetical protein